MRYAVKLGEIILQSDKPIGDTDLRRALRLLAARDQEPILVTEAGEVLVRVTTEG